MTTEASQTPIKILIAEDERDIRELVGFTLTFGGYRVVEAANGREAVEKASEEKPDLIILDVRMPKLTGYQACEALKGMEETKHIPVAFLSAKGQESEVQQGMQMGAIAYILKPFAPEDLLAQITSLVKNAGVARQ
ncbi:MAG: response regulator [Chloroflexi bacterium]|nr:response regulator [Chloroflexota bacterium]